MTTLTACSQGNPQESEARAYLEKTVPMFLTGWDADALEKCGVKLTPTERDAFYKKHFRYGNFQSIKECNKVRRKAPVQPLMDFDMEIQFDKRVASAYAEVDRDESKWKLVNFKFDSDLSDDIDDFNKKQESQSQSNNAKP